MFNIKYNFLVLIQIFFSLLNAALLVNVFGISAESDAYLLSCSILVVIQLILTMPVFQFIPFYNDLKNKSIKESQNFYNFLFLFSLVYGITICLILCCNLDLLIKIFTLHIDASRLLILRKLLAVSILGSMFYTILEVNTQLLNAEMKFSLPYILNALPNAFCVIIQLYLISSHKNDIFLLAYGQALSLFIAAFIGTLYIFSHLIKFRFVYKFVNIFSFIKNSITMQFGNSIYHICFPIILNNFLASMPQGNISCFYYAKKVLEILNSFTIGPSARILKSKIAKSFSKMEKVVILHLSKRYMIFSTLIFCVGIFLAYFIQVPILQVVSNFKLNNNDIQLIQKIYLSLCPWYFFMMIENPYVLINIMSKKSSIITIINSSFILICFIIMFLLSRYFNIYTIGIATMFAQLMNFIWHRLYAKNILNRFL